MTAPTTRDDLLDDLGVDDILGAGAELDNPAGHSALNTADRIDEFPTGAVALLDDNRVFEYYVPVEYGGKLDDYAATMNIIRTVAGRSVTLAVAHGKTFLGAVTVWVGADQALAQRVADVILAGTAVSWGLTERGHGSDLLSGDMRLTRDEQDNLVLDGEKWLINNATRGGALTLLVRSKPEGGPRGFDLVFFDKSRHDTHRPVPKELTHGIRGADISGIRIDSAIVDEADLVGRTGTGLETVLRGLQLTRTLCCALSLGAADSALEAAMEFARTRNLYGRKLIELPDACRILGEALADQFLNEAFAFVVARSIHELPAELSVHCAAAKFLVPTRTEAMIRRLRGLVGARSVLDGDDRVLGRIERDHRIVSLFDGNTVVNLSSMISQFSLVSGKGALPADTMAATCRMDRDPEPVEYARLSLLAKRGSSALRSLAALAEATAQDHGTPDPLRALIAETSRITDDETARAAGQPLNAADTPNSSFVVAERLSLCLGAACAIHFWYANRDDHAGHPLWHDGLWLEAVLGRVLGALRGDTGEFDSTHGSTDRLLAAALELFGAQRISVLGDAGHRATKAGTQ
ncbi:acyl-CoA dehydrogenase family protein [Nocardia sp. NPDC058518]|uniref:acyl-CoA dehydrogenase family protein n=1 Tax=Nocardia sp. NPDC058518 TaxID=3346534 RepID=UPI003651D7D3